MRCQVEKEIVGEDRGTSEKKLSDGGVTNRFAGCSRIQSVCGYYST